MPSPFAAFACAISAINPHGQTRIPGTWPDPVVKTRGSDISFLGGEIASVTYTGGVEVTYGRTTLIADTVTIDELAQHGVAKGHIHIEDPDAIIDADEVEFTWTPSGQSGHIESFAGTIEGLNIRSASADASARRVQLDDVTFQPSHYSYLYRVQSKQLTFVAGKYVRIKNPHLRVLGVDIPWHKTMTFNQDPRVSGSALPAVSYAHGSIGVNYNPNVLIEPQTQFQAWANVFQGDDPHYGLEIAHTYLKPSQPNQGRIIPASDLDTRFGYGYFDNVKVESPQEEYQSERLLRSSIAYDTDVNQGSSDRLPGGYVTKLGEVIYENGGPLGSFGQVSNFRLQTAREEGQSSFTTRLVADTSIGPPPLRLLPNLYSVLRFDAQGFAGDRLYGWSREQVGLSFNPVKPLSFSAAYVTASEAGEPDLTTDQLYNNGAWCFRADAYFKSIQASYLLRHYLNGIFLDNEYEISQVVGALKVSVLYRTFPSDFRFGVTFRLDDMIENFKKHHEPPPVDDPRIPLYPVK